jgi:hypothetical protein
LLYKLFSIHSSPSLIQFGKDCIWMNKIKTMGEDTCIFFPPKEKSERIIFRFRGEINLENKKR